MGLTLTAAGIAGLVLTIGLAVDTNVIIFERIKEELSRGKSYQQAVNDGLPPFDGPGDRRARHFPADRVHPGVFRPRPVLASPLHDHRYHILLFCGILVFQADQRLLDE